MLGIRSENKIKIAISQWIPCMGIFSINSCICGSHVEMMVYFATSRETSNLTVVACKREQCSYQFSALVVAGQLSIQVSCDLKSHITRFHIMRFQIMRFGSFAIRTSEPIGCFLSCLNGFQGSLSFFKGFLRVPFCLNGLSEVPILIEKLFRAPFFFGEDF